LLEGRWVATAESCTAGLLAARLTERPGSSAYLAGGVVSYSNEAKAELLGVGRARTLRGGRGGGDHRHSRARWRQRGEAGGLRVLVRAGGERPGAGAR